MNGGLNKQSKDGMDLLVHSMITSHGYNELHAVLTHQIIKKSNGDEVGLTSDEN